ncbi:MAG TPA: GNAT family protein [Micromonosporaceae bacterium]
MAHPYPPLNVEVRTPRLALVGATDDRLEQLIPIVRAGIADSDPPPFDDPMSLYDDNPGREWRWLRGIWAGRGRVDRSFWRLYFVVTVDGEPIGMQDLIGIEFATFGTVSTFSWLCADHRGRGIGREMRAAVLHLAFAGLAAREATSEAFIDNPASNRVSEQLGYQPNGTSWATRRGHAALLQGWRLTQDDWARIRRDDIELAGIQECRPVLGL